MDNLRKTLNKLPVWIKISFAGVFFIAIVFVLGLKYHHTSPYAEYDHKHCNTSHTVLYPALRWDTCHFMDLAEDGYQNHQDIMAFFPLYSWLVAIVHTVFALDVEIAALLTSWIFCILSLIIMYFWFNFELKKRRSKVKPWQVLLLFLVFPTAFFMALAYTESLFIFLTVSAIFAFRTQKYRWCFLAAALAALTRVPGMFLAGFFFLEIWRAKDWKNLKKWAVVLAPALGVLIYMLFSWKISGSPLAFLESQQNWGRVSGGVGGAIGGIIESFGVQPLQYLIYIFLLSALLAISYKMLGFSWGAYLTVCILMPIISGTLMSVNRYSLTLVPMFLALALWLEKHKLDKLGLLYIILSVIYFSYNVAMFFTGHFVG
jgi:hypothetical protein